MIAHCQRKKRAYIFEILCTESIEEVNNTTLATSKPSKQTHSFDNNYYRMNQRNKRFISKRRNNNQAFLRIPWKISRYWLSVSNALYGSGWIFCRTGGLVSALSGKNIATNSDSIAIHCDATHDAAYSTSTITPIKSRSIHYETKSQTHIHCAMRSLP